MSPETAWRSEEERGSRGQAVAWLDITILLTSSEVRGIKWVKTRWGRVEGRMVAEAKEELSLKDVLHLVGKAGNKVISSEGARRRRGEEGREHGK